MAAKLGSVVKVGAAAVIELGIALPTIAATTHEAFAATAWKRPSTNPFASPTTLTCAHNLGSVSAHHYAITQAWYSSGQTSRTRGVGGIEFTMHSLPGTWNWASTTKGPTFVDQEQWLTTLQVATFSGSTHQWLENGVVKGGHPIRGKLSSISTNAAYFFARGSTSTKSNKLITKSFAAWDYSSDSGVPYYEASQKFAIVENNSKPSSNSQFSTSVAISPVSGHGHTPITRHGVIRHRDPGPYFTVQAGTETACLDTTDHVNNWYDGSGTANAIDVSEKVYDTSTHSWKWLSNWLPSSDNSYYQTWCPSAWRIHSNDFCHVPLSTGLLWSDTYNASNDLTSMASGEHP